MTILAQSEVYPAAFSCAIFLLLEPSFFHDLNTLFYFSVMGCFFQMSNSPEMLTQKKLPSGTRVSMVPLPLPSQQEGMAISSSLASNSMQLLCFLRGFLQSLVFKWQQFGDLAGIISTSQTGSSLPSVLASYSPRITGLEVIFS